MNKEFIAVVTKVNNGDLRLERVPISKEYVDIKDRLQEMKNNPNRSLLDMQGTFTDVFKKKEYYYLCLAHYYSSSYIDGIRYPSIITFDEYSKKLEEKRVKLKAENKNRTESEINRLLDEYKQKLKDSFYNACEWYITAYNFSKTSSEIRSKSNSVMLSTEHIGWTTYEYKVNDDVTISINTNFGYGSSSYFFLNLKYKEIDILPYSAIVRYYNANIVELRRHTREYNMSRDSWNVAFDFVVNTVNTAKNFPDRFIKEWIVNEINEMVEGLQNIAKQPETEINRFIKNEKKDITNGFCYNVRNINAYEIKNYSAYKDEMNIAFQAEKISGALLLLDKLSELVPLFSVIQDSINTIKLLNQNLIPKIEKGVENIQVELDKNNKQLEVFKSELDVLNNKIAPHKEKIDELVKEDGGNRKYVIEMNYKSENPEYKRLCTEIEYVQNRISEMKERISKRKNFITLLNECLNRIQTYVLAA